MYNITRSLRQQLLKLLEIECVEAGGALQHVDDHEVSDVRIAVELLLGKDVHKLTPTHQLLFVGLSHDLGERLVELGQQLHKGKCTSTTRALILARPSSFHTEYLGMICWKMDRTIDASFWACSS